MTTTENLETETTVAAETAAPAKRITKRGWVTLAVSAGAIVVAAAIATPVIASNIAHGNAIEALTASEEAVTEANAQLAAAYEEKGSVIAEVPAVYTESGKVAALARPELIADVKTVEALNTARTELVEVSGVTVSGANVAVPEAQVAETIEFASAPSSIEGIVEQTEQNTKLAKSLSADAKTAAAEADAVEDAIDAVNTSVDGVVASGKAFAAKFTGYEKGSAAAKAALTKSVEALAGKDGSPLQQFQGYVTAFDGLKKSHTAAVDAEKAAAEKAAKKVSKGNSSKSSTVKKSSSKKSTAAKKSTTSKKKATTTKKKTTSKKSSGSKSGGSTGGSNTTQKTPPTFTVGGGYVPMSQCDGKVHHSHQVGWGGNSRDGGNMGRFGKWSATVKGDTVYYYICL